jgi:cysteinyl-tRNA synthetase
MKKSQPSTPVPVKRKRSDNLLPRVFAEPGDSGDSDDLPISQLKRRQMRVKSGSLRRIRQQLDESGDEEEQSSPNPAKRVHDELRDDFRTRGSLQQVEKFIGSSSQKKSQDVEAKAWITQEQLLNVDPSDFKYPVLLASSDEYSIR